MSARLVVLELDELRAELRALVAEAFSNERNEPNVPALLNRNDLARALGVSLATLNRLRLEPGFPVLTVGDSPRFELAEVLAWLRARRQPAGPAEGAGTESGAFPAESVPAGAGSCMAVSASRRKCAKTRVSGVGQ